MEGPLYHFLVILPVFALVLMFLVLPSLQWLSVRLFDRKFVLRFSGGWKPRDAQHRRDFFFSVTAFVVSFVVSFLILQLLMRKGILPPL